MQLLTGLVQVPLHYVSLPRKSQTCTKLFRGIRPAFIPRPKPKPYCPHPKYKGFLALYYHYCYLLGRIEKRQYLPRMTPHLRREIMKAET